ncbi:MAG TPA: hypothetical protein ENH87_01595 [Pricia antarctica]|uniref:GLPGLI family protein n=1 Tax=Pricia antarctica TaxID=641691 RepID=A0A831QJT5_9FLAO|nr:hypothetical protein [Pricia antarctica]
MKNYLTFLLLCIAASTFAQKMKIVQGEFDFLPGQKAVNVAFTYDNTTFYKENMTEEEFIEKQYNEAEEKSKGSGNTWKKKWAAAKETVWQPKFLELMNRTFQDDHDLSFQEGLGDAKYTLIVDTTWLYPGWDAAVMKQPAKVSTNLKFVETANKDKVLAEVTSENAPGDQWGSSFSNEDRMGEGYAKTGKSFAKLVEKKAF